ncbi:hypothetical protein [Saccharothrix xinjiangensis]|uniref:Uncharacterized protein n=1 Tax=Saccharothrix xinjiangensis TaxID=204798 RepID=A0ABV9XZB7_9PSEU
MTDEAHTAPRHPRSHIRYRPPAPVSLPVDRHDTLGRAPAALDDHAVTAEPRALPGPNIPAQDRQVAEQNSALSPHPRILRAMGGVR